MDSVNFDCQPGDVIRFLLSPSVRVTVTVLSICNNKLEVEFGDTGRRSFFSYTELRNLDAFYVSRVEEQG